MKTHAAISALAAVLLLSACAKSPEELAQQARTEFAANDYGAARTSLVAALTVRPDDRELQLLQVRTLLALGDGEGARSAVERLAGNKPPQGVLGQLAAEAALLRKAPDVAVTLLTGDGSVEANRLRAAAALQKQDAAGAIRYLDQAVAAGGSGAVFADYTRLLLLNDDVAGAQAMHARAQAMAPGMLAVQLTGAELAIRQGDLARALASYTKAAQTYPGNTAAMTGKAAVLGDLGRFDEMEQALAPLAAAAPKDPVVAYLKARLAASRKNWDGVRQAILPVEAGLGQQDPVRLIYAEALTNLGQAELAIAQAAPIARANPDNREALRILAEAQFRSGDPGAAMRTFAPVVQGNAVRPEELALYARLAKAAGAPDAGSLANRAKAPSPQALGADLAEGDAAMKAGNWARAAVAYDRILAVTDGRNVLVLNNMAYAQAMLGNLDRARELADKALKLAPDNASVLDTAGWVRIRSGKDLEQGKALLRKAAQKAPGNAAIRAHLAEAENRGG
ncbi:tetratricopeptide repeat protein [Novosphingobium sp.]|uniref:tetratricopeptide repeat protein n=1 Tax=Novosphingobium sp. TaxID=1874826 RepID=UPI002735F24E|nr:tetratricopeptide repeat protein [Novosphingobium sp.]MDP3905940.1 tetratricopeptide repeat protein [Novosphingobium sp.]